MGELPRWDGDVRQGFSMNTVDIGRRHQVFSSVLSWLAGGVHRSFRSTKTSLFNRSSNAPPSIYLQPICRVSASDTGGQKEKIEHLNTLRYKHFVLSARLSGDGRSPG